MTLLIELTDDRKTLIAMREAFEELCGRSSGRVKANAEEAIGEIDQKLSLDKFAPQPGVRYFGRRCFPPMDHTPIAKAFDQGILDIDEVRRMEGLT